MAISIARSVFFTVAVVLVPPRTVGSLAMITHSTPSTTPTPGEHAGADGEVGAPRGERRQLEQRGVGVDEQLDALAAQQLAALAVAGDVLVAAAVVDERQLAVVLGEQRQQVGPVGLVRLAALVDVVPQHRHRPAP